MERENEHAIKRKDDRSEKKHGILTTQEEDRLFWQKRTLQELTEEDIREINSNLVGYFEILLEWHEQDLLEQSKCPDYRTIPS